MLLMGDEVRRTQRGNNNAYCQDNEISWFDWTPARAARRHPPVRQGARSRSASAATSWSKTRRSPQRAAATGRTIEWHGVALNRPDWGDHSHSLAFTLRSLRARFLLHGMLNAYWEPLTFELPAGSRRAASTPGGAASTRRWRRPTTSRPGSTAPTVEQATYVVQPRSVVLLALALPSAPPEAFDLRRSMAGTDR